MSLKRRLGALIAILGISLGSIVVASPAQAAMPAFQMPFPCGETWKASTYNNHPAIDWNFYPEDNGKPVVASASGTATLQSQNMGGFMVVIDHGGGWKTVYAHLQQNGRISGNVAQGQVIGYVGGTGNNGNGFSPHLHWEQQLNGVQQTTLYANGVAITPGLTPNSSAPAYTSNNCSANSPSTTLGLSNSKQLTADFNEDGKTDVAAFYNYGGWHTAMWVWYGQANGMFTEPVVRWENTTGWNASFIIPAGAGDFNGDGHQDVSVYYRYETGELALWTWFGNGTGSFAPPTQSWLATTGWDGSNLRVTPTAVADYNNDGKDDIVSYFRYDGSVTRMWAWYGQSNGTFTSPVIRFEGYGWDGQRILGGGGGDFNGDGQQDVASIYRHDGGMLDVNIWYGNGTGSYVSMIRAWHIPSGWEGARLISSGVADYNGDGRADLVTYYRYDNNVTRMWVFYGQADGYLSTPVVRFEGFGWDGSRVIGAGTGDFNGDGHQDVASFYRHDNYGMNLNLWFGNSTGIYTSMSHSWYTPSGWDGARIVN